jgi:hypothetical protein
MNFFKRMIVKWVREDWENASQPMQDDCYPSPKMSRGNTISTISGRNHIDSEPTLQFKVYSAVGGKIVEFTRYDRKSDRHDHQVYIINKDEDFGEKIAKISTLEVLR